MVQTISDLYDCLLSAFKGHGGEAEPLAAMAVAAIQYEFRGLTLYVPKPPTAARDEQIKAEFSGKNYRELAAKYQLSTRRVRYIIDGKKI